MEYIKDIAIFTGTVIIEALPFILLGVVISAIIEEYVSSEKIAKMVPKGKIKGTLFGVFLGLFIPACDCAVIPVAMKLKQKKMPTNVVVSFMTASPVINPVVLFATFYAFRGETAFDIWGLAIPKMFVYRTIIGIILSFLIGLIVDYITKDENVLINENKENIKETIEHDHNHNHNHDHNHEEIDLKQRILNIIGYMKHEFLEIMPYMILGALFAGIMQTFISARNISSVSTNKYIATFVLMIFAYLLSLCSTSDSFIAKTFMPYVPANSVLAFLLLGPMIDIKNTIVLSKGFSKRFVMKYIAVLFIVIYVVSVFIPMF